MTKSAPASKFSFQKREYLHAKLDEIIKLWSRGCGQGFFYLTVNDGAPSLQFGVYQELEDEPAAGASIVPPSHEQQEQHRRRHRGPAQKAKNNARAAAHRARIAAAAAADLIETNKADDTDATAIKMSATAEFPGTGMILGEKTTSDSAVNNLPLQNANVTAIFPSTVVPIVTSTLSRGGFDDRNVNPRPTFKMATCSTTAVTTSNPIFKFSSSTAARSLQSTSSLDMPFTFSAVSASSSQFPGTGVSLANTSTFCSWCRAMFDRRSTSLHCSTCNKWFHTKCNGGHDCDPPDR